MSAHGIGPPHIEVFQEEVDAAVAKWFEQHPFRLTIGWGTTWLRDLDVETYPTHSFAVELDVDVPANATIKTLATSHNMPVIGLSLRVAYKTGRTVGLVATTDVQTPACLVVVAAYALA
jgi:hypothetical protein